MVVVVVVVVLLVVVMMMMSGGGDDDDDDDDDDGDDDDDDDGDIEESWVILALWSLSPPRIFKAIVVKWFSILWPDHDMLLYLTSSCCAQHWGSTLALQIR